MKKKFVGLFLSLLRQSVAAGRVRVQDLEVPECTIRISARNLLMKAAWS